MATAKAGLEEQTAFGNQAGCRLFYRKYAYTLHKKFTDSRAQMIRNYIADIEAVMNNNNDVSTLCQFNEKSEFSQAG